MSEARKAEPSAFHRLSPWKIIISEINIFVIACSMNSERLIVRQKYLKHISVHTYAVKGPIYHLWRKSFTNAGCDKSDNSLTRLLNWIHVKHLRFHKRFQLSTNNSRNFF